MTSLIDALRGGGGGGKAMTMSETYYYNMCDKIHVPRNIYTK